MRKGTIFLVLLAFLLVPVSVFAVPGEYVSTASINGWFSYANTGYYEPDMVEEVFANDNGDPEQSVSLVGRVDYTHYVNLPDVNEIYNWCLDLNVSDFDLQVNGYDAIEDFSYSNSWDLGNFAYAGSTLEYVHNELASLVYYIPDFLEDAGITYTFMGDAESGTLILTDIAFDSWLVDVLNEYEIQTLYAKLAGSVTLTAKAVPEPGTILLLGFGLVGLAGMGRKKLFKN